MQLPIKTPEQLAEVKIKQLRTDEELMQLDDVFAASLYQMARQLQNGEIPDLSRWEPHWYDDEERAIFDHAIYERRSVRH